MKSEILQNNLAEKIIRDIIAAQNKQRVALVQRFFQTGPGQYGEGDIFLGMSVPTLRKIVKKYDDEIDLNTSLELLTNKYHEIRLAALYFLVFLFKKGDEKLRKKIFNVYLKHISKYINNWDLVDASCEYIVGAYCFENKDFSVLEKLVKSRNLWERRVGVVSTFYYIRNGNDDILYKLLPLLKDEKHHLMWKASGWMLREAGKRVNRSKMVNYLSENYHTMPSVMRSYACEHLNHIEKLKVKGLLSVTENIQ
jgi:3-methyladenine DNA glycosylase AlkD